MPLVTGGRKNSLVTVLCLHELAELVAGGCVSGGAVTVSFFRFWDWKTCLYTEQGYIRNFQCSRLIPKSKEGQNRCFLSLFRDVNNVVLLNMVQVATSSFPVIIYSGILSMCHQIMSTADCLRGDDSILYLFHVVHSVWLCVCTAQCKANCTGVSCKISVVMSTVYVGCHAPVEPHLIGCCRQPCFKPAKCTKASYTVSVSSRCQAWDLYCICCR